jgi:ubiquinol-cytochrome c reductase cytochrome c subunit
VFWAGREYSAGCAGSRRRRHGADDRRKSGIDRGKFDENHLCPARFDLEFAASKLQRPSPYRELSSEGAMVMRRLWPLATIAILSLLPRTASGQDAAKFFEDNCSSCHEIGGPPGDAPDLKDVTKRYDRGWLIRFIRDPQEAAEHDPVARALVKKYDDGMPETEDANREIIEAVLRFIEQKSAALPAQALVSVAPPPRAATPADVAAGRDLYFGRRSLTSNGPSCVACHQLASDGAFGGGVLGPDLTAVHARLGGTQRLSTWLARPPTRVMRAVFRDRPLAGDEPFVIAAMLGDASAQQPARRFPAGAFVATGAAGAVLALLVMGIAWSGRLRAVRRPLVGAARNPAGGGR